MSPERNPARTPARAPIHNERVFKRFNAIQRWEHGLLLVTFTVLLLTGLPQKYFELWGHQVLTTPGRMALVRQIHHISAVLLTIQAFFHVGRGIYLMARRSLSSAIFPTFQDVRDAGQMLKYLLFLRKEKPRFGKFNFEQKFTYWFFFFGIAIMILTGFILWFPIQWTRIFPGAIIPAALLAHSNEAIVAFIFLIIWHFYHVHFERLNLSIFSGRMNEREMREHHPREFERLTGEVLSSNSPVVSSSGSHVVGTEGSPGVADSRRRLPNEKNTPATAKKPPSTKHPPNSKKRPPKGRGS